MTYRNIKKLLFNCIDLVEIIEKENMADLSVLTNDVEAQSTVVDSIVTLVGNLVAEIKAAGTDPVALKALTDKLEGSTQKLADLVTANTPAAGTPVVT